MASDAEFEFAIQIEEKVAQLDLNRPEEGNRLTGGMIAALARTIRRLGERSDVNIIAIRSGGVAFCRGRDGRGETSNTLSAYQIRNQMMGPVLSVYAALAEAPIPVVACVHAEAIGFGAALVGGCDIAVASANAEFAFPEIMHNIAPTMAMSAVIRKLPPAILSFLIYSGERLKASEAWQWGLVGKVYPAEEFSTACAAFLKRLSARPRPILETIKKYQNGAIGLSPALSSDYAGALLALVRHETPAS
ncbi:MAG: enoyl-CoA hydratase/isomerase family protein [Alphaproteobacteria bacterium]|nr:enoyl-CoA hydratase/isomerase family protein [Alphaproteobacteria bacterium]